MDSEVLRRIPLETLKALTRGTINNPDYREFLDQALEIAATHGDTRQLRHALAIHSYPVHIEEFLFGQRYLRRPKNELYPAVVEELVKINEHHGRLTNRLTEFVGTGGIGSAKTTTALYTQAYQLYLLSCYKNPHQMFSMDSTSEILFIFQNMNATLSKEVDFARFQAICKQSYYFTTVYPFDPTLTSTLKFPNRVEVKPIGTDGGSIGQNVLGGLIDEVNFMAVVKDSKKNGGRGEYDQAQVIYDSVSRRIKSRFLGSGGMPGILCLVSSKNYPGEFTDIKVAEAAKDPTIYVYDKRVWEIKPPGTFSGEMFQIFVGDETRKARVLSPEAELSEADQELVIEVPEEYRKNFETDIIGSLRDIAGVSTIARYPFILDSGAVDECMRGQSVLSKPEHDFEDQNPLQILPGRFRHLEYPRWVHVDLAITGDSAGVTCGYCPGFTQVNKQLEEVLPVINLDFILRVVPPKGGEIKFYKIRELLQKLRDLGLPIKWVSFDSFQSVDSVQLLRQAGFATGYQSVDTSMLPYEMTKQAFYDRRIHSPVHKFCQKELISLEKVVKKKKIDHPPNGSKDCADSLAGVVYGLSTNRWTYAQHRVPLTHIPGYIQAMQQQQAQKGPKDDQQERDELQRAQRRG